MVVHIQLLSDETKLIIGAQISAEFSLYLIQVVSCCFYFHLGNSLEEDALHYLFWMKNNVL